MLYLLHKEPKVLRSLVIRPGLNVDHYVWCRLTSCWTDGQSDGQTDGTDGRTDGRDGRSAEAKERKMLKSQTCPFFHSSHLIASPFTRPHCRFSTPPARPPSDRTPPPSPALAPPLAVPAALAATQARVLTLTAPSLWRLISASDTLSPRHANGAAALGPRVHMPSALYQSASGEHSRSD